MHFLFNDVLIDLGEPCARLVATQCPIGADKLGSLSRTDLLALVQGLVFVNPGFAREQPEKAAALAALVHLKTGANALLCVRTSAARTAAELPLRLAQMSLSVIGDLVRRDREGRLSVDAIDRAVWAAA